MSPLEEARARQAALEAEAVERRLLAVALDLRAGRDATRTLALLNRAVRLAYYQAFTRMAVVQQRTLGAAGAVSSRVLAQGGRAARTFGDFVTARVETVLRGRITADPGHDASAYARMVAQSLQPEAARAGAIAVAAGQGVTRKMFVRLGPAKEPRSHSSLEGSVIPVDAKWNLGGVMVDRPGDPVLPLSERINCHHGVLYLP